MSDISFKDEFGNMHQVGDGAVLIFIDETGEETLNDPKYPIFGLAACIVQSVRYTSNVFQPWNSMKEQHFDGINTPLHASELRNPSSEQMTVLNNFFTKFMFGRCAAVISDRTIMTLKREEILHLMVPVLYKKITSVLTHLAYKEVIMIIEDNQRLQHKYSDYFSRYSIIREIDGKTEVVPVERYFMRKQEIDPGLEIADFIAHTAGTCVRERLAGKRNPKIVRPDYAAIFEAPDKRLTEFFEITEVES